MAGVVTTSLVVQFGNEDDAANYQLIAEIDSRPAGFNNGNTSFKPGDSPTFLVYKSAPLALTFDFSTGGKQDQGFQDIDQVEFLTFANETEATLSKPPIGSVTIKHIAGVAGATLSDSVLTIPTKGVAVYKVTYQSRGYAYRMIGIPTSLSGETAFPVVVVVTGTSV